MSNSFFQFKQFIVRHDHCAMKVGTDGVLLGAWGTVEGKRILDIGTGTGLIALMAAQRNPDAQVLGIDIDKEAVLQARENIAKSPFAERVTCILQDIATFCPKNTYDAILCNPPFFTEDTLPDETRRALARNSKNLPFSLLVSKVASLLTNEGKFSVIIPSQLVTEFVGLCITEGLYMTRHCIVRTKANKPPRRALLTFSTNIVQPAQYQELCLTSHEGNRSQEYIALTKDFYI